MTYVRNPGFPDEYNGGLADCKYTVSTINTDIHHLRLDFETFSIKGPSTSNEVSTNSGSCHDSFTVMVCLLILLKQIFQ